MKLNLFRDPKIGRVYYKMQLSGLSPSYRLWIYIPGKGYLTYHSLGTWGNSKLGWAKKWHKLI